ncbi:MAG: glycosyltransferase family 87 protein [Candidatus Hodarchaeota archaeon]
MSTEKEYPLHKYFIYIFTGITIFFIILRIILYFFEISPWIKETKDIDFKILLEGMENGLIDFYDPITISDWPPYYLYFWYYLFFYIWIIPTEGLIGVYVWDALRLILMIIVIKESPKVFKNKKDLLIFYVFGTIGYSIDAYYNNVNFLIVFLLFYSFIYLEKDQKWIAGILFTLATFKITAILFVPVLLIIRKIKFKDLIYYLIPFAIICIPYMIFPEYFFQMVKNWGHSDAEVHGFLIIDSVIWKALQPSHLMFIALLLITFLENIETEERKNLYRIILVSIISIYYIYLTTIVFIIPVVLG